MTHTSFHSRKQRGFTLVETLVAIAILMIALVGPYFSIQQAIMASYAARDQLIASQLAQEGMEYIYYLRDNNFLAVPAQPWLKGMDSCIIGPLNQYGCAVDPALGSMIPCQDVGCTNAGPLKQNSNNGLYTQTGSYPATRFTRIVQIASLNANEVEVTVTVNWITENHAYTVKTVDDLYNWL